MVRRCVITWELGGALHSSRDVMTIHERVGDGGVAGRREQAGCRCCLLCGVEGGEMTEVSDAGLHPGRPEEVNLLVCC